MLSVIIYTQEFAVRSYILIAGVIPAFSIAE